MDTINVSVSDQLKLTGAVGFLSAAMLPTQQYLMPYIILGVMEALIKLLRASEAQGGGTSMNSLTHFIYLN